MKKPGSDKTANAFAKRRVADELAEAGWSVWLDFPLGLPNSRKRIEVDVLARKGDQVQVIEVVPANGDRRNIEERFDQIRSSHPEAKNWKFVIRNMEPPREKISDALQCLYLDVEQLRSLAFESPHPPEYLCLSFTLLAATLAECALSAMVGEEQQKELSLAGLARAADRTGLIDGDTVNEVLKLSAIRNSVAHRSPLPSPSPLEDAQFAYYLGAKLYKIALNRLRAGDQGIDSDLKPVSAAQ